MWRSTSSLFESSTMLNRFGLVQDDGDEPGVDPESEADDELVDSGKEATVPGWAASR